MSGASAIAGYTYQKDYAAFRILSSEALRLIGVDDGSDYVDSFTVEGPSADGGSAWDIVWNTAGGDIHLRECKDTEIEKRDRKTFYRRVRKEIAHANHAKRVTIGWVTDASKQGKILDHLDGMRGIAHAECMSLSRQPPPHVNCAATALSEALYYLCEEPLDRPARLSRNHALCLLRDMRIETFRAEQLSQSVCDLAASLFDRGAGNTIRKCIQGGFDALIQTKRQARYTRDDFLAVLRDDHLVIGLAPTYRDILQFHSAASRSFEVAGVKWARLPGAPEKTWSLLERLPSFDPEQSRVLIASTGNGKTTSSLQAAQLQSSRRPPMHVLWFDAGMVSTETVKSLPMLCLLLCGVAPTWIGIDGLDQIHRETFHVWAEALERMQTIPQLTMLMSARSEVVSNHEWMQKLITSLGETPLGPLTGPQIDAAFRKVQLREPSNPSLRSCLQNPFLFSVYARTVDAHRMPLEGTETIGAFNVIEEFWKRRVTSESSGARGAGDPTCSLMSKRAAIHHLAEQTLCGHELFPVHTTQDVANGIEMLCNESVLTRHTTTNVKWSHAWFREYAIVDFLLGTIPSPSATKLGEAVCEVSCDHVARDAANGACKWIIAHSELGSTGGYLQLLYETRPELAREVMIDVMAGAERHLTLVSLSSQLLIETIELACYTRAAQWVRQIAELPDDLFAGERGPDLARVVIEYETKMTVIDPNAILERLIRRDGAVRTGGNRPAPRAEAAIIEYIGQRELYANATARNWLVDRAGTERYWVARRLFETLAPLIQNGYHADALSIFQRLLARDDAEKGRERQEILLGKHSMLQPEIKEVIATEGLVSTYPQTWGAALVELQADLLKGRQARQNCDDEVDYEDYFQQAYFLRTRKHDPIYMVAEAIRTGLAESVRLPTAEGFQILTDALVQTKWGLARSQPLVTLLDLAKQSQLGEWQCQEAIRLLTLNAIVESSAACPWRRLLRSYLLPRLRRRQIIHLVQAVRQNARSTRVKELSDFRNTDVLEVDEIAEVAKAQEENRVSEPYDPRELRRSGEGAQRLGGSSIDWVVKRWPFVDEHSAIMLLVNRKQPTKDVDAAALKHQLFCRLDALRRITQRDAIDEGEWFGQVLQWCAEAISDLRRYLALTVGVSAGGLVPIESYLDALHEHCPWWRARADAGISRLEDAPPRSHFEEENNEFGYIGGDPIAGSLRLFDELLTVANGSGLDRYREALSTTICDAWDRWPVYTRGVAIELLESYHWAASAPMRELLVRSVRNEVNSKLLRSCLTHLLQLRDSRLTSLMQHLLGRISGVTDPVDTAHLLGEVIGNAVMRYRAGCEELDELETISRWFDEIRDHRAHSSEVRQALITSILAAAELEVALSEHRKEHYLTEWLSLTRWGIGEWLDDVGDAEDTRHLPSTPIRFARQSVWSSDLLVYVLSELKDLLIRVFQEGSLGEIYSVHFELSERVEGKHVIAGARSSGSGASSVMAFLSDAECLEICRASAERVAGWRREGKVTNDLAYGSSLSGQDSKRLIEQCFETARDRNHVRRELAPIVDVLAEAGLRDIANELRIKLRRG